MPHRTFGQTQIVDDPETYEPITFDLAYEKDIACRPRVNGKMLLELMGNVNSQDVAKQSKGIISVFDVCVLREDGDDPEAWSGRPFDRDRPLEHHTQAELDAFSREDPPVQPGIDPTSSLGRLDHVLDDPNVSIELLELAEMVGWLVEQYTGRPTRNAGRSTRGSGSTSRGSRRGPRSRAGTGDVSTLQPASTSPTAAS